MLLPRVIFGSSNVNLGDVVLTELDVSSSDRLVQMLLVLARAKLGRGKAGQRRSRALPRENPHVTTMAPLARVQA